MKPGPKKQPAELAAAKGNPGHRAITPSPPESEAITTSAPSFIKTKRAREIWAALMPVIQPYRFVKTSDEMAVGRYCIHLARFLDLNDQVAKSGVSYETDTNHGRMLRLHPHFAAMMRIEEALVKLEDRIGLTPAARQSLMVRVAGGSGTDLPSPGLNDPRNPRASASPIGLLASVHAPGNGAAN